MSLREASRNLSEVVNNDQEPNSAHYKKLKEVIDELDIPGLREVLEEGKGE